MSKKYRSDAEVAAMDIKNDALPIQRKGNKNRGCIDDAVDWNGRGQG